MKNTSHDHTSSSPMRLVRAATAEHAAYTAYSNGITAMASKACFISTRRNQLANKLGTSLGCRAIGVTRM